MKLPERWTNLRAGAIYAAANVAPTTARTWPISIGVASGEGHPRYDASDALALAIMRELTQELKIAANFAAFIVEAVQPSLRQEIASVVEARQQNGRWTWEGGKFVTVWKEANTLKIELLDHDQLNHIPSKNGPRSMIAFSLLKIINSTTLQLDAAVSGEDSTVAG